jgi:hypothetical protein
MKQRGKREISIELPPLLHDQGENERNALGEEEDKKAERQEEDDDAFEKKASHVAPRLHGNGKRRVR